MKSKCLDRAHNVYCHIVCWNRKYFRRFFFLNFPLNFQLARNTYRKKNNSLDFETRTSYIHRSNADRYYLIDGCGDCDNKLPKNQQVVRCRSHFFLFIYLIRVVVALSFCQVHILHSPRKQPKSGWINKQFPVCVCILIWLWMSIGLNVANCNLLLLSKFNTFSVSTENQASTDPPRSRSFAHPFRLKCMRKSGTTVGHAFCLKMCTTICCCCWLFVCVYQFM